MIWPTPRPTWPRPGVPCRSTPGGHAAWDGAASERTGREGWRGIHPIATRWALVGWVVVGCVVFAGCGGGAGSERPAATTTSRPGTGSVALVVDGDTFEIALGSTKERVRLIGIDAPETGECLADASRDELARLVTGRPVELSVDQSDRDRYGRLLRYVHTHGIDVNAEMVRRGLALSRPYPPDTSRQRSLDAAQSHARSAGVGIWAPDACGPASSANLTISAITPDPPGDDSKNLNGELVQITNSGPQPTDLTGWVLRDESASKRFAFPAGFVLHPSQSVNIRSGCGADNRSDLYWCERGSAIWNNTGDTAFLLDPSGNIHTSHPYG